MASSPTKTGKPNDQETPLKDVKVGSVLEADTLFKSPYYSPSYDFPWNPDPLCSGNSYSKYDEMRDDDQIKAVLSLKKDFVVSTGWRITSDRDDVAEFVTQNLEELGGGLESSFDDILRNLLTCYDYGFALSEPVYELIEGKYRIKNIVVRPPHSFTFEVDDKGVVKYITQYTTVGKKDFSPDIFLHIANGKEFSNPYGTSDLRAAFPAYKAKKFIERMYARYVEKHAGPTIVGHYPPSFTEDEIAKFHAHLEKIQNSTAITVPEGATIDFKETSGQGSDIYIAAINHYNMMMARSVLVPDLLGISGGEIKGGAFALGKEQFKLFLESIKKDRLSLSKKITQKVVMTLVKINFGDVDAVFEFKPFEREKEMLDLWVRAVAGKIYKPSDDEINHFRSAAGFPEGPVEIPEPVIPPAFPGSSQGNEPDKPSPKDGKMPLEDGKGDKAPVGDGKDGKEFRLVRQITQYEKKVDFALAGETLVNKSDRFVSRLTGPAKDIQNSLVEQIRDDILGKRFNPDKINQIQPKFLKDMNIVLRRYFTDLFKSSTNQAQRELFPDRVAKFAEELLPEEFLDLLQSESFKVVGDYSTEITKKARNIALQGIKNGVTHSEVVKLLREELSAVSERWLDTLVRTKTTEIYNEARKRYWETDEDAKQIVEAYQVSAILDDRTSEICEFLDGKIISIEESRTLKPPFHYNCRSILVPITKFENYELSKLPAHDKLQDMGGNLLMYTTQETNESSPLTQVITAPGATVLIEKPGDNRSIMLQTIDLSNLSIEKPIRITLKDTDGNIVYPALLDKNGGRVARDYKRRLPAGAGLIIDVEGQCPVSVVIEYKVN